MPKQWVAQTDVAHGYALLRYMVTGLKDEQGKPKPDVLCGDIEVSRKGGVTYALTIGDAVHYGKVADVATAVERVERMIQPTETEKLEWALAAQGEAVQRRVFS